MEFSKAQLERARKFGDVTPPKSGGVVFHWELAGSSGARFALIPEAHHTDEDIRKATEHLKRERDVVGRVSIATIKD